MTDEKKLTLQDFIQEVMKDLDIDPNEIPHGGVYQDISGQSWLPGSVCPVNSKHIVLAMFKDVGEIRVYCVPIDGATDVPFTRYSIGRMNHDLFGERMFSREVFVDLLGQEYDGVYDDLPGTGDEAPAGQAGTNGVTLPGAPVPVDAVGFTSVKGN